MKNEYLLILFVFLIYLGMLYILNKKKSLEKYNIFINGPLLMIKSSKFLNFIEKISSYKKFWTMFSDIGFLLFILGMFFMFFLTIKTSSITILDIYTKVIPKAMQLNQLKNIFLLPGINDFIPVSWGCIALIITLVVHEMSHAIVSRIKNINVKSLGILLFLIPIGAFAELDGNELYKDNIDLNMELKKSKELKFTRIKILSSGVMGNFMIATIALSFFFGPVLNFEIEENPWLIASSTSDNNGMFIFNLQNSFIVKEINNIDLSSKNNFNNLNDITKNSKNIKLTTFKKNNEEKVIKINNNLNEKKIKTVNLIKIVSVDIHSPAYYSTIKTGDIIIEIDNLKISTSDDFIKIINIHKPLDTINIKTTNDNIFKNNNIQLNYKNNMKAAPYLGITCSAYSYVLIGSHEIKQKNINNTVDFLKSIPYMLFGYNPTLNSNLNLKTLYFGLLTLISFPIISSLESNQINLNVTSLYNTSIEFSTKSIYYYLLSNSMLWIGWMNLYVGLFNCLPAYPLDGGNLLEAIIQLLLDKANCFNSKKTAYYICLLTTSTIYLLFSISLFWPFMSSYFLI